MYTVRVVPIARGIFKEYLTFFSREEIPEGSVVPVLIRGKKTPALVIGSRDLREEKLDIRSADFTLKKLGSNVKPRRIFSPEFIEAAFDIALWHAVYEGVVLQALTPSAILAASSRIEEAPKRDTKNKFDDEIKAKSDVLILQAEQGERIRTYRNLAREAFARNASVVVMTPTIVEAEKMYDELSRGIEDRVIVITSELSKNKLVSTWNNAVSSKTPVLVIGTPLVLSLPLSSVDTIVIERESARAYRMLARPYIDFRRVAERVSRKTGARLVYADFPVRVETRYLVDTDRAEELARSQLRQTALAEVTIIDSRATEAVKKTKRAFQTITPETKQRIESELKKGGRVAVFTARRGLAPLTVCNDCGTPVMDPVTGVPMVLHKTVDGNVFLSHRSGAIVPAHTPCKNCGGWNLATLGIGVDRVFEELRAAFPETTIRLLTTDSAKTHAVAKKISKEFFAEKGSIIVGTERMLPYLTEPVELTVVASIDSMLSQSSWRAHEQTLAILFYLRERTENALIVETRKPDHAVVEAFQSGNPSDFYRADTRERTQYGYPPFATFIGLTWRGSRVQVEKTRLRVEELLRKYDLVGPLPATQTSGSEWEARAVIRVQRENWPNAELAEVLRALSPLVEVMIDPDEIV